ncbi:hypothetical protein LCGC14_2623530, partial [marine sediment metagenome]
EGYLAGAYGVLDGPEQSSWTFSLPKMGEPVQHYELTKIPWHAGLPGDRRQDTSLIGNLTLVGKEIEGKKGEAWTKNQLHWSAKIDVACRALCPAFGANPPTLRKNMWEHRWLSATSCPSGRNPWAAKFALISTWEDDMSLDNKDKEYLAGLMRGVVLALGTGQMNSAMRQGDAEWEPPKDLLDVLNAIGGIPSGPSGGLTEEEAKEAAKQAAREGTG